LRLGLGKGVMNLTQRDEMSGWQTVEIIFKYYLIGIGTFLILAGILYGLIVEFNIFSISYSIIFGTAALILGIVSRVSKSAH
jgi:hypothetical protein